jgi:hypothetical protein
MSQEIDEREREREGGRERPGSLSTIFPRNILKGTMELAAVA